VRFFFFLICLGSWTPWFFQSIFAQNLPEYLHQIDNIEQFNALKGDPNTAKFSDVEAVKVLYKLSTKKTYYINSSNHDYHSTFCQQHLGYPGTISTFNLENYTRVDNRAYLMATINRFHNGAFYTIEFSVADNITAKQIQQLYQIILNSFHLTKEPKVFLNTSRLREIKDQINLPTIEADEIFKGQNAQLLNYGVSYGYLRQFDFHNADVSKIEDIALIDGTPAELPPVAGVITTDFQTPLSHITLLCKNRGTPLVASKKIHENEEIQLLLNQAVRFEVSSKGFSILPTTADSVLLYWKQKNAQKLSIPLKKDTLYNKIIPIRDVSFADISKVGGKAANFALLSQIIDQQHLTLKCPEDAFAIPIYFYHQHLNDCGANKIIDKLIALEALGTDPRETSILLDSIQVLIFNHPINPTLIIEVEKWMIDKNYTSFRFRSSTNAEDLDGFNGAGLYQSKTGQIGNAKKSVEKAIKTVWASAWGYRPYKERAYFGIDQKSVGMGVLCHRNFDNELANGVVITKNLYRPNYRGFVINAQFGQTSVVIPPDSVVCEQVICYSDKYDSFLGNKSIVEYLSYSNILPSGMSSVLHDDEIVKLTREIAIIKEQYYQKMGSKVPYYEYGLDLEFKVVGTNRQIYLKQIRPFND